MLRPMLRQHAASDHVKTLVAMVLLARLRSAVCRCMPPPSHLLGPHSVPLHCLGRAGCTIEMFAAMKVKVVTA